MIRTITLHFILAWLELPFTFYFRMTNEIHRFRFVILNDQ
jgi:hypothetical protein